MKDPRVVSAVDKVGGLVIDFKTGEGYKKELLADFALFKEILPALTPKK
jgi:hypothetical protein